MEYPAMLYKAGGSMLEWDGAMWDFVIVADDEEQEIARAEGYGLPGEEPKAKAGKKAAD